VLVSGLCVARGGPRMWSRVKFGTSAGKMYLLVEANLSHGPAGGTLLHRPCIQCENHGRRIAT
jgi:hypothetical protein